MATTTGKGKKLTPAQIAQYAYQAGFRGQALIDAVAIALAESGGFTGSNNTKGEDSRGLWQINVAPNVRANKWGDLSDPAVNAKAAFEVSGGGKNFNPWTTYAGSTAAGRASSYKDHLTAASAAASAVQTSPGGIPAPAPTAPNASDKSLVAAYGGLAVLADIPELKKILDEAIAASKSGAAWTQDTFDAKVKATKWYKERSTTMVEWEVNRRLHPKDAEQQIASKTADIQVQATQVGFTLTKDRARAFAVNALKFNQSDAELQRSLLAEFHFSIANPQGATASLLAKLKQTAKAYFVPISDIALGKWVDGIVHGTMTEDSFDSYVKTQAKSLFPHMGAAIDAGMDLQTYADPYVQIASQELGTNPEAIDMSDPKWSSALIQTDPKTGERTSMNLDQWRTLLRTDPKYGWNKTVNASNMAADWASQLEREMGKVA